jgi:hypothetical protein
MDCDAMRVDERSVQIRDIIASEFSSMRMENVLDGCASGGTTQHLGNGHTHTVSLHLLDSGMVLNQTRVIIKYAA